KFNISLKLQGIVLLVIAGENVAVVNEFQFTENGYENIRFDNVVINVKENVKENLQSIRDKICGSSKPQKILVIYKNGGKSTADFLRKKIIKSKNVFMSGTDVGSSNDKFVIEWSKWLLDKSNTKYYVIPRCGKMFSLFAQSEKVSLITVDVTEKVPLEKSANVSKVNGYVMVTYDNFLKKREYACLLKMEDDCHRMKIAMTVDAESFPIINYTLSEILIVTQLPETLNKKVANKIPIIGFYDDCSVICVFNEKENCYKFLDAWNGKYGKPLVMSFDSAKPLLCSNVYGNKKLKRTSFVYDLIKIMSMSEDNIQVDERWPFIVIKNDKNSVLIEYENCKGERKTATPTFLMAMLLKEHLNEIKNETGQNYTEFGFYCFHDFTEDEKMNVAEQLSQSFNLMKLQCTVGIFPPNSD
uniref:Uncharacterized protein n=1 Tax=Panagrolaimus sp. PS1159 TaxID=55785 RepID=A0AC35GQI2_9BILA